MTYNGKLARVFYFPSAEVCCNGRYRVELIDDGAAPPTRQFLDVKPENIEHACRRCHKGGEKLMLCGKCKNARYCDGECQRIDWESHKKECGGCGLARDATKNPLILALKQNDMRLVQKLVEEDNIDVNMASNTTNRTILQGASAMGRLPLVQYLLQHGADLHKADNNGVSPLYLAASGGYLPVVRLLVEQGADKDKAHNNGFSPLFIAAQKGHLGVARYLVEQGADKNKADNKGFGPIHIAAQNGHLGVVQYLVEQGTDVNMSSNDGRGPVSTAAQEGHLSVVRYLAEQGAETDKPDNDGLSPLFVAALKCHLPVLRYLLEQGADKDRAGKDGFNSLFVAIVEGNLEVVRMLVEHGADVNTAASSDCGTLLHVAAHSGHAEILSCLMSGGASLTARDCAGDLPIDRAANEKIKQLIRAEEKRRRENPK